jgi:hypothetical protein
VSERVLLTGARTAIALEVARAFHRSGHRVFVADTFPRYVTAFSNCVDGAFTVPPPRLEPDAFLDQLLRILSKQCITRLIPMGEEVFYIARGRERLAAECEVFCDALPMLDSLHDKVRFQQLAAEIGAVPITIPIDDAEQLAAMIRTHGPVILKQVNSRFGRGVRLVTEPCALPPGRWLAQQFIRGREICSMALARAGRLIAHVSYEPRFRIPFGPGYCATPVAHAGAEGWVRSFVARNALTGAVAFDFIESTDGTLYPLECNPRLTSGVHLFPRDGSLAAALLGERECFPPPQVPAMWSVAMLGHALPRVRTFAEARAWFRAFAAARDVFWDRRDLRPMLHMFASHQHLRTLRKEYGLSFAAAATFYTEWGT